MLRISLLIQGAIHGARFPGGLSGFRVLPDPVPQPAAGASRAPDVDTVVSINSEVSCRFKREEFPFGPIGARLNNLVFSCPRVQLEVQIRRESGRVWILMSKTPAGNSGLSLELIWSHI